MSGVKYVQAIADNAGQTDTELVFSKGEIIAVVDTDTGSDGWWEGYLLRDKDAGSGFFPESFAVPIVPSGEEPASGPYVHAARAMYDFTSENPDDLPVSEGDALLASPVADSPEWTEATRGTRTGFVPSNYVEVVDAAGLDGVVQELAGLMGTKTAGGAGKSRPALASPAATEAASSHDGSVSAIVVAGAAPSAPPPPPSAPSAATATATSAVSGTGATPSGEMPPNIVAAIAKTQVPEGEKLYTITDGLEWMEDMPLDVQVTVTVGEKRGKFGGLKKFTCYTITTTRPSLCERRYKHFDWFHQVLTEKYRDLALPNLPEKQYSGRFDEHFLVTRRRFLELYLNDLVHHPIVGRSDFLKFFLEEQMGGPNWKAGKRALEKEAKETGDKFLGNVLCTPLPDPTFTGERIEAFMRYLGTHEKALQHLCDAENSMISKRLAYGAELEKEKERWAVLAAEPCWLEDCAACGVLSQAMKDLAATCHWENESLQTQATQPFTADMSKHVRSMALMFQGMRKRLDALESAAMKAQMQQLVYENGGQPLPPGDERAKNIPDSVVHARAAFCAEIATFHERQAQDLRAAFLFTARQQRDHHSAMAEKWAEIAKQLE